MLGSCRVARMWGVSDMPRKHHLIPRDLSWLLQIFGKRILTEPDGIVFRKASAVDRQASEPFLIFVSKSMGFQVTRFGTHYIIHRDKIKPEKIT